jgi:hypothetical protein
VLIRQLFRGPSLALAALGCLIALAAPGQASTANRLSGTAPTWRVVDASPDGTSTYDLLGITATGPRNAWAFGRVTSGGIPQKTAPVLRHWDGRSWREASVPPQLAADWSASLPIPAGSSTAGNVWAFMLGNWARWNGSRWSAGRLPLPRGSSYGVDITATAVLSRSDVWVVGDLSVASIIPYVGHFNGHRWSFQLLRTSDQMVAVSASGPANVWIAGNAGTNLLSRWNGSRWQPVPMPAALAGPTTFGGLVVQSADSVWITGLVPTGTSYTGGAWHWNGHHWRMYQLATSCALTQAASDGHGGLWASFANPCPHARLWHESGDRWTSSAVPDDGPYAYVAQLTAVPGTSAMLAAGVVYVRKTLSAAVLLHGRLP